TAGKTSANDRRMDGPPEVGTVVLEGLGKPAARCPRRHHPRPLLPCQAPTHRDAERILLLGGTAWRTDCVANRYLLSAYKIDRSLRAPLPPGQLLQEKLTGS